MKNKYSKEKDFFLVQKALCGDQGAYSEIYKKYKPVLSVQISAIINDSELASDIVMETFEKAFCRMKNFQPDYQLGAWLTRIGRNCAIDHCRKMKRRSFVSIDEGFDEEGDHRKTLQIIDEDKTPEESIAFKQRLDFVHSVICKMPNIPRRVLQMKFFDDLSYEEIADEMNFTTHQVRSIIRKSKEDLIELMSLCAHEDITKY